MNPSRLRSCVLLLVAAGVALTGLAAPPTVELRSFGARSFAAIKQAHAGRPFIIAFWSVTCEPCREEMMVVTEVHKKHPKIPIVLVAADPPDTRAQVLRFLGNYPLGRIDVAVRRRCGRAPALLRRQELGRRTAALVFFQRLPRTHRPNRRRGRAVGGAVDRTRKQAGPTAKVVRCATCRTTRRNRRVRQDDLKPAPATVKYNF